MPPRFLERMQRQSDVLRDVFGDPENDPPPYPFSPSQSASSSSSFQYRRSRDLSAYQGRFSQDSSSTSAYHRRSESHQSSSSLHYRQSADDGSEASSYNFPPPPGYVQATTPTRDSFDITAISRDSLVLVTGANSFQGLHIVDQLLQHGFRVRGTIRDAEKAVWTAKLFRDRYGPGRYTTAVIPDMAAKNAFDIAVRSCAGIIHVACVTSPSSDPHEVITPSIAGALNALEAASKEPTVRRVVFTSCASAAVSHDRAVRNVVGGESWNLFDFEDAWGPSTEDEPAERSRVSAVLASSKMQAEQAVWKWVTERRPTFVVNSVLPDTLFGSPIAPPLPESPLPRSVCLLQDILVSKPSPSDSYQTCGHFVNVADSATIHLAALLFPDLRHERIFAVSIPWTRRSIHRILEKQFPEKLPVLVTDDSREGEDQAERMDLTVFKDVEKAEGLLRRMGRQGWRDLEGSVRGSVEGFL